MLWKRVGCKSCPTAKQAEGRVEVNERVSSRGAGKTFGDGGKTTLARQVVRLFSVYGTCVLTIALEPSVKVASQTTSPASFHERVTPGVPLMALSTV